MTLQRLFELREPLILPPSLSPPANKLESAVGPLAGAAAAGGVAVVPPPPPASAPSAAMAGGRRRWRMGRSSKRGRLGDEVNNSEHHGENPAAADAAAAERPRRRHSCKRRRTKQESGTSMVVMSSAPDLFDGYQWKKYGQKQIEGAMYPRSYYRCTRSADQGCAARRTVQRNDDDGGDSGGAGAAAAPKYTVVRVGEHTCTANDSPEAPVILETTAAVVPASNSIMAPTSSSAAAASCSATAAGTEPPAIFDNTWSTITSSVVSDSFVDDYYGGLFAAVHDNDWVPALAAPSPSPSVLTIEDFAGPIRSPVHVYAADGWTIDQLLLQQLVNEPTICRI